MKEKLKIGAPSFSTPSFEPQPLLELFFKPWKKMEFPRNRAFFKPVKKKRLVCIH
jgi:hypothetical protein